MSRISLYIGMSLDGYIADENGGVDWMLGDVASRIILGRMKLFYPRSIQLSWGERPIIRLPKSYPPIADLILTRQPMY